MKKKFKEGFTLVEMIIVIAIIAVLLLIIIPIASGMISSAQSTTCAANRKNLLTEIEAEYLLNKENKTEEELFTEIYTTNKDKYVCPSGGTFTFEDGEVKCSKHSYVTTNVSDNFPEVILSGKVDDTVRSKGEKMSITKGTIYKIGSNYYVATSDSKNRTVGSNYESWLQSTYSVKKIDFTKVYTDTDFNSGYISSGYNKTGVGYVYNYKGKLYIQNSNFTGNLQDQSSDPTNNPGYWSYLGVVSED